MKPLDSPILGMSRSLSRFIGLHLRIRLLFSQIINALVFSPASAGLGSKIFNKERLLDFYETFVFLLANGFIANGFILFFYGFDGFDTLRYSTRRRYATQPDAASLESVSYVLNRNVNFSNQKYLNSLN